MSVSFDEDIWDKLKSMRNSSEFVNGVVSKSLDKVEVDGYCDICGAPDPSLIWVLPDEKLMCEECYNNAKKKSKLKLELFAD